MANFDDIFSTASSGAADSTKSNEDFDVSAWAQKKQGERDGVFAMLDENAQQLSSNPDALRS